MSLRRRPSSRSPLARRRGALTPLFAVLMPLLLVLFAFSIDLAYLSLAKTQVRNAADAAAVAAAADLYPDARPQTALRLPLSLPIYKPVRPRQSLADAAAAAQKVVAANSIAGTRGGVIATDDLRFGVWEDGVFVGPPATLPAVDGLLGSLNLLTADHGFANAARVTVRRDAAANGRVPLFFASAFGVSDAGVSATASAAISKAYGAGPGDRVLPLAMDVTVWNAIRFTNGEVSALDLSPLGIDVDAITVTQLLDPGGPLGILSGLLGTVALDLSGNPVRVFDDHAWDHRRGRLAAGSDGIWEVLMLADLVEPAKKLPILGTIVPARRVPALFVTLDFRGGAGTTPDASYLNSVVTRGLPAGQTLTLPFEARGHFEIPNAVGPALEAAKGQTFILPLYATLPGTVSKVADMLGRGHTFRIVGWAGVVVTDVNLTGPVRYLKMQPAAHVGGRLRPAEGPDRWRSRETVCDGVYTPPRLVE